MTAIAINLLRWSTPWEDTRRCIDAVLASTFDDFSLTYTENLHDSASSLIEQVRSHFGSDPRINIVRNETNLGYAGAHNRFFAQARCELVMVLNPDAILTPLFLSNIVGVFSNPQVGAATGKMLKPSDSEHSVRILDGTGIQLSRTRRAKERGQLQEDHGQFDKSPRIFGVSGTAAVYRMSALESVKLYEREYFDPDFFAYFEDFDLSWRLRLKGFECLYVPEAIVEHTRSIGVSPGGVKRLATFIRHHRAFPLRVRQWSWRNHMFTILKNDFGWPFYRDLPLLLAREVAMILFIVGFMPDTLLCLEECLSLLPKMLKKRSQIQASRTIDAKTASLFFT